MSARNSCSCPTSSAEAGAPTLKKVVDASSSQFELLDAMRQISARLNSEAEATRHGYVSTVACVYLTPAA